MLRSAEEILHENLPFGVLIEEAVIKAINEARIEAIKECGLITEREINGTYYALGEDVKQSILSLIEQVK